MRDATQPSTSPDLAQRVSDELLPAVRQPAQYVGGEVNQLVAPGQWQAAEIRVALAFPDTYAIGMSHLGSAILYWIAHHTPGVVAERVYCPWIDAERVMRDRGIELFTWDTRRPVRSADLLAVTLQSELCYTNLLTLLDLAGMPLRASQRDEDDPLVIVGGPQADHPEPVAEFVDGVVVGDGEPSLPAILERCKRLRRDGVPRREWIPELAQAFDWFYAPGLYRCDYRDDGTLRSLTPAHRSARATIARCRCDDLESAPVPLRPLVPHTEVPHDRISIEIMRGCPHLCRFCHAGYTRRPVRRRSVERILEIAEQSWAATGCDEIGLLSLSTADYPDLERLTAEITRRFAPRHVSISVPSLRVDKALAAIPEMVATVRKAGLTLAPEAARDPLRRALGKRLTDDDLFGGLTRAYRAGWRRVKLYFLVGFPGEAPEDIDGIWDLAARASRLRKELGCGAPANVTAAVSWLVPKPHTAMQYAPQPDAEYFLAARRRLRDLCRGSRGAAVRLAFHRVEQSILEAVFARGDRRLGAVIETAWRDGARFDHWTECFDDDTWRRAFAACGIDPAFYAHRERRPGECLPWSHITGAFPCERLRAQYEQVQGRNEGIDD